MRLLPALGLLAAALLLLGLGAWAVAPREVTDPESARTRTLALPPPTPRPARVTASLPRRTPVRAREGDVVVLRVPAPPRPDVLRVARLRHEVPIGPGLVNVLTFVADRPGTFAVTIEDDRRRLGTLVVRPR